MLIYGNRNTLRLILFRKGSMCWRRSNIALSASSAMVTILVQFGIGVDTLETTLSVGHHYGMIGLGMVVSFAVVFRTQLGWGRYWEAVSDLHVMYTKWSDAFSQMSTYTNVKIQELDEEEQTQEVVDQIAELESKIDDLQSLFVLLSAVSADRLVHGDCETMSKMKNPFGRAKVMAREVLRASDEKGAWHMPEFVAYNPPHGKYIPVSRDEDAMGPTNVNQWDSCQYLVFREPSQKQVEMLRVATDRTSMVLYWILFELSCLANQLSTPAPIQSRMYQELSSGNYAYQQAIKLADTPFPWPFAQMMGLALLAFLWAAPVYIATLSGSSLFAPLVSFAVTNITYGLHRIATELENPFGPDPNDIFVPDFHLRFMDCTSEVVMADRMCMRMYRLSAEEEEEVSVKFDDSPRPTSPKSAIAMAALEKVHIEVPVAEFIAEPAISWQPSRSTERSTSRF